MFKTKEGGVYDISTTLMVIKTGSLTAGSTWALGIRTKQIQPKLNHPAFH